MTLFVREDGIEFILQPYRESLTVRNKSLLRNEIQFLSQNNGDFVRLFKQPSGHYEAVFFHEPGYLLGEHIWYHLNKPKDLIYCEALPDQESVVLIVVRGGKIHLDAQLSTDHLFDEFTSLLTGKHQYEIVIYGHVPIMESDTDGKFAFFPTLVSSFTRLEYSLIDQLTLRNDLRLLQLNEAVNEHRIGKSLAGYFLVLAAILSLTSYVGWLWMHPTKQEVVKADPYLPLKTSLQTPDPSLEISSFANALLLTYGMPGWVSTAVQFDGNMVNFEVHSLGGTTQMLMEWAKANGVIVNLNDAGAHVEVDVSSAIRKNALVTADVQQVLSIIIDRMMGVIPGKSVEIKNEVSHALYHETNLEINFHEVSPQILSLIGKELSGLPLCFRDISAKVSQGLASGKIKLTALGK